MPKLASMLLNIPSTMQTGDSVSESRSIRVINEPQIIVIPYLSLAAEHRRLYSAI